MAFHSAVSGDVLIGSRVEVLVGLVYHLPFDGRAFVGRFFERDLNLLRVFVHVILDDVAALRLREGAHFLSNHAGLFLPGGQLLSVPFQICLRNQRDVIVGAGVGVESLQPVIIRLADRVILVVVAPRAGDGQAHEHRSRCIGDVVQNLLPALHQVAGVALVGVMAIERSGHPRVRVARPKFIAGDLFLDKAVARLVVVE